MDGSYEFRRGLALRLLALIAASLPVAGAMLAGCADCPGPSTAELTRCFPWPPEDAGVPETGGGGGGGEEIVCPSRAEAEKRFVTTWSDTIVNSDGTLGPEGCCYEATVNTHGCTAGRPFLVDERVIVAPITHGHRDGFGFTERAMAPALDSLSADERAALARAWGADGQLEHASIASFGRFALSLLAVGAPADLIDEAHRAALDEVRHARLCFGLASVYAGEVIGPGSFPFEGRVDVTSSLAELSARTAEEGCIGETLAACVAAEQLAQATDPAVRAALRVIVADESRHAELAFRVVAWAIRVGGASVRAAVAQVFASRGISEVVADQPENAILVAHGRLGAITQHAAMRRAMHDVVRPAARSLLDTSAAHGG